jgi:hypothetical protein
VTLPLHVAGRLDICAASGLLVLGDALCVVADDELFLSLHRPDGTSVRRVPIWEGGLPEAPAERKRIKPDLEALAQLEDGRLLILGSGSRSERMRGALVDPARDFAVQRLDLTPLLSALASRLPQLNIEGAAQQGERLWLLQRGNGRDGVNALIELDLASLLASCARDACADAACVRAVQRIELGAVDGVALGFTDAAPHPAGGVLFSAVAEDSQSTYDDGRCVASAVGWLAAGGVVRRLERAAPAHKIEGIALAAMSGDELALWLVCDADDRRIPALLLSATWPG